MGATTPHWQPTHGWAPKTLAHLQPTGAGIPKPLLRENIIALRLPLYPATKSTLENWNLSSALLVKAQPPLTLSRGPKGLIPWRGFGIRDVSGYNKLKPKAGYFYFPGGVHE